MNIICATNMPFAMEAFSTLGATRILEGRHIRAEDVREVELLALRSTTKVDRALLEGSPVRFVGTATIGTDHLDIPYLERQGITWCFAPGCNANSVSEYVTAGLLHLAEQHGFTLAGKTIGVVGVGNVGRRVVAKAKALGLQVLMNDPPWERAQAALPEGDPARDSFVDLDTLVAGSDIITVHVPLTKSGKDKTVHLVDAALLSKARRGVILINAARGPVVESSALLSALDSGHVAHVILDTWEGEPDYRLDLVPRVDIATPHIAGHSFEGKVMGTVMVYQAACRFLGVAATWSHEPLMPRPLVPEIALETRGRSEQAVVREIVRQVYDLEGDDRRFRASAVPDLATRLRNFDRLRQEYPGRREFRYTRVSLSGATPALRATLSGLGFTVVDA